VIVTAVVGLPDGVGVGDALALAGTTGRLRTFDFSFDLTNQYTFWSGTIAALFLFCSYFGTDQTQAQRYLTARSVDDARHSLLMSAYWKIPLQVLVLVLGILVFVFYTFNPPPLLFSTVHTERMRSGPMAPEYAALESSFSAAYDARRAAAQELAEARGADNAVRLAAAENAFRARAADLETIRQQAAALVKQNDADRQFSDVNYIIPSFILTQLPIGLIGILIIAIILAATDSIAAELNSLATTTVIDIYKRWVRPTATDAHYLGISKAATALWGLFAAGIAVWAAELGSLIEVVNRFGSFFYGSILGVFILAVGFRRATGTGAFVGLIAGMSAVAAAFWFTSVAFLWHNVIGAVAVVVVGLLVSSVDPARRRGAAASVRLAS
jgi:Na+/proline symporter